MHRFFDLEGKEISKDEFVEKYKEIYFYLNDYRKEKTIDTIYLKNRLTFDDFVTFLRWKVGDDGNGDTMISQYGGKIKVMDVKKLFSSIEYSWKDKNANELLEYIIRDYSVSGIGGVYGLALVSLITKGREPIYDRFAEIALDAIIDERQDFRKSRKYTGLPDKSSILSIISRYNEYKEKLTSVFDDDWKKPKIGRDIDRALWTYGHLFR